MNVGLELAEQFKAAVEKIRHEKLVSEIQEAVLDGAELGAKWQREQLRTDEAVERLADALCVEEEGMTLAEHEANCELPICGFRQSFLADARRNITALLGEEP